MPQVSERLCTHTHTPTHLSTWQANTWTWVWIPIIHVKNPNIAVHACDLSLGEDWGAEIEGALEVTGQLAKQTSRLQVKWKTLSQKIRREGSNKKTDINLRVLHSWAYICTEHIYNSKNNNNNNSQVKSVSSELLLTTEVSISLSHTPHILKHSLLDTGHGHGTMGAHNTSDSPWHMLCRLRTLIHGTHCSLAQCPQASCSSFS